MNLLDMRVRANIFLSEIQVVGRICAVWVQDGEVFALIRDEKSILHKVSLNGAECNPAV